MESSTTRKTVRSAVILLAAAVAACGGSTQSLTGTAPSAVAPLATSIEGTGNLALLKEGRGNSPDRGHSPAPDLGTPTDGTELTDGEPEEGEIGEGQGHGKAMVQIEGVPVSIAGACLELTIDFGNGVTVVTDDATEFQRAECLALLNSETPVRLHIAAKKLQDGTLVASYVRMQGPKFDEPDAAEEEEESTTSTTGTVPK